MTPFSRIASFRAQPDAGAELARLLLHAASLLDDVPGCESWRVHRDRTDPDLIHVTEVWASREQCDASLQLERVVENVQKVMPLLLGAPEVIEAEPLGGARQLRGRTGSTSISILDEPDLTGDDDAGEARYVREPLGTTQTGLSHYTLRPGRRQGWAHRHAVAEEVYVALAGSGQIKVDDELHELQRLQAVRVAPASIRELEAGPDGLEILAFGSRSPGDGELVADWWTG